MKTTASPAAIEFSHTVTNTGENPLLITSVQVVSRFQIIFSTDRFLQVPDTSLAPNESTIVSDPVDFDICIDGITDTFPIVTAKDLDSTLTCGDEGFYEVDVCSIGITVTCEDGNGTECMQLTLRDSDCMVNLTFTSTLTAFNDLEVTRFEEVVVSPPTPTIDDLIPSISPVFEFSEQTVVSRTREVNLCQSLVLNYVIVVRAARDKMRSCNRGAEYTLTIA